MKIVQDAPGQRLELAETEPRISLTGLLIGLALTALVATPWRGLWAMGVHGAGREALDLAGTTFWGVGGLLLIASAVSGRRLEALTTDRSQGRLRWRESRWLGLLRTGGDWATGDVAGFTLELARPVGRGPVPLRLTLRRGDGRGSHERRLEFRVTRVESTEAVADFALRLGAAAGLSFQRVVLNESGRFAMELAAKAGPGLEAVPAPEGRAGDDGAVSAAATRAAAIERIPAFDPAAFRGDARVTRWEPGREVRIERGPGLGLLAAPLLLCAPLGPTSFLLPGLRNAPLLPHLAATGLLTLVGLGLGLMGWAALQVALPRRALFDWGSGRLRLATPFRRRELPFSQIAAIELRPVVLRTERARGGMVRTSYWTELRVRLHASEGSDSETLLATDASRVDAVTPRLMALPLARELAAALRVELRETTAAR